MCKKDWRRMLEIPDPKEVFNDDGLEDELLVGAVYPQQCLFEKVKRNERNRPHRSVLLRPCRSAERKEPSLPFHPKDGQNPHHDLVSRDDEIFHHRLWIIEDDEADESRL